MKNDKILDFNDVLKNREILKFINDMDVIITKMEEEIDLLKNALDEIIKQFDYSNSPEWRKDFKEYIFNIVKKR